MSAAHISAEIATRLHDLAEQHDIRMLYACESGSRAWGFASPDSDYDIRFLFAYPRDRYLQLDEPRDTVELMDGDLDFAGWDIRKALRLLRNTNPALLEWLNSPIIYYDTGLRAQLASIAAEHHSPIAVHWHYLKMAKGNYFQYIKNPAERGEAVLAKKYLYVANPLAKLLYFERTHRLPPLDYFETIEGAALPIAITQRLKDLARDKMAGLELGRGPADPELNAWIAAEIARLEQAVPAPTKSAALTDILNNVLLDIFNGEAAAMDATTSAATEA